MHTMAPLTINIETGLARHQSRPTPRESSVGHLRGGPEVLLEWLETQLGLVGSEIPFTDRVTRYATLLAKDLGESYRQSFEVDRWATADELLRRRDELKRAGWDGSDTADLPNLIRDLARVEGSGDVPPGDPDRLEAVLDSLDAGQVLPGHVCIMDEAVDEWPPLWRRVLELLNTEQMEAGEPTAPLESTLHTVQAAFLGLAEIAEASWDDSFRSLTTLSTQEACQAVAAMLAADPDRLPSTAIYAPDPAVASLFDEALDRLGLPTMGATRGQTAQPALQVLPLAVEMLWEPVDPNVVMDLLSLPVGPIPRRVVGKLARALAEQPGLGSTAWEEVREELTEKDADPGGKVADRLERWFDHPRVPVGQQVTASVVRDRCGVVAQWARGYAEWLEDPDTDSPPADGLAEVLRTAASQAAALGELAETQGGDLTKPQVVRMLEDVRRAGARAPAHEAQAGGPNLVETLADVPASCDRLVWLGTGLGDAPTSRWTARERDQLKAVGVEVDDGTRDLRASRAAERRGLARVAEAVLVVHLPGDIEQRTHPLWVQVEELLAEEALNAVPRLRHVLDGRAELSPWPLQAEEVPVEPPQPERPLWNVPSELLVEPPTTSGGELRERLGCPIRWVFRRVAEIEPSKEATLPNEFMLKGRFCHDVLERVFGDGGDLPSTDDAVDAVAACFDDRLTKDAAPLAQPAKLGNSKRLRAELLQATRVFVDALHRGGYRVVAMEEWLDAELDGRPLYGRMDVVLGSDDGEAIVDFKLAGRKRFPKLLREGRAIQLAVYAACRAQETDADGFPEVAYLILTDAQLYTPEGSPLRGVNPNDHIEGAPPIEHVWTRFVNAVERTQGWLTGDGPVPARPLQDPDTWPAGTELVVDADESGEDRRPCKYCNYKVLCGLRRCP